MPIQERGFFNHSPQKTIPGSRENRGRATKSVSNHNPGNITYGNLSRILSPNSSHKVRETTGHFTIRPINIRGEQVIKMTPVGRANHHKR